MPKEKLPPQQPGTSQEEDFSYRLLTGHKRTDGTYKHDRELRMEYINLTDELIHKMTDGLEVTDPETGETETRIPDTVIFLDKSARPLAWLVRELWDKLAPEPGSDEIPNMPDFRFLSIDREQWVNTVDPDGTGAVDISRVDESVIRSLRSIFISPERKSEGLTEAIDEEPTSLDGKTIMVVDEVRASGRTLDIAEKFVQRAFPDTYVGGAYWMSRVARIGEATGNADLPVWYKKDDMYGRGVGDRHTGEPSENITQRLGSWFLSSRLEKPDTDATQLRKEFHQLAQHPDVPIRPSKEREDVIERHEALNGGLSFEEVQKAISEVTGKPLGGKR